jgi:peroxiredoxin
VPRQAEQRAADLKINIDQRRLLVESTDRLRFIRVGDSVPPFIVREVGGSRLELERLLTSGPVVVIFFRFAGCPTCNITLHYYQRRLWPALRPLGVSLLALSPQIPDRLIDIKARHALEFLVATDHDNELARRFAITYCYDEPSRRAALDKGRAIGDVTGTGTWELRCRRCWSSTVIASFASSTCRPIGS